MRLIQRLRPLIPSRLFARMALILLIGLLAAQSLSLWLHWGERATVINEARGQHMADRIAEAILRLEADPTPQHQRAVDALQSNELRVTLIGEDQVSPNSPRGQIQANIASRLGSEREIRLSGGTGGGIGGGMRRIQKDSPLRSFELRLNDGQWVRIVASREASTPALPSDFYYHLLFSLVIVGAVVMLAVRQATRPLQQLAEAADRLGQNLDAPPLTETGSTEVRTAAAAFNRMRDKIRCLIDERSRALAAVSHDLRTPLTRMRLRSELIEDELLRDQIASDIEAMAQMIDATLDYLRGIQESEPVRSIDINALLHSLAEDSAVVGRKISVEGLALAAYPGRLSSLRRALQNLIDNAFKYGRNPGIHILDDTNALQLIVEDDGPGIPQEALSRVTEPYYRPGAARSSDTGGIGLGLSIVKDVALIHGGQLILANRPQGGLSATLLLPRETQ